MIALAALLLLAQVANPAPLPEQKPCVTQAVVIGTVEARNPTKEIAHVELDEERRKLFIGRYNIMAKAVEDGTVYEADTIMIMAAKEVPTVLAFAFKGDCLVFQDQIPLGLFVQLIDPTHDFPPKPTEGVAQ